MSNESIISDVRYLVNLSLAGEISDIQFKRLNDLLSSDAAARSFYLDLISMNNALNSSNWTSEYEKIMLADLADFEQNAPEVFVAKPEPPVVVYNEVSIPEKPQMRSKFFQAFDKIVYIAAVLMIGFIIFGHVFKPDHSVSVATVVDQIGVQWDSTSGKLVPNERVRIYQEPYKLEKGIIKLAYDEGVDVVIEGPAEFEIERDGIYLGYGRIYAKVSQVGQGFTVDSTAAKYIDLGTEFGVQVEKNGSSEVHVLDGSVQLYAGLKESKKETRIVNENYAMRFDAANKSLEDIPVQQESFARNINSSSRFVWRGQKHIDLADIVGGGDGFGKGQIGTGIDPSSGKYLREPTLVEFPKVKNAYTKVDHPFIDGVFVPNGIEDVVINSNNDTYSSFEETRGDYRIAIMNGPAVKDRVKYPLLVSKEKEFYLHDLSLDGVTYGTKESPALYLHSNIGITFDINNIISLYPVDSTISFTAFCGIPDEIIHLSNSGDIKRKNIELTLYLFVDNKCVLSRFFNAVDHIADISIPIPAGSEFISIVVTDHDKNSDYDWCVLGRPTLKID